MKRIRIITNKEFVKNMSDELLDELINLKEPLPIEIMAMIRDLRYHDINTARLRVSTDELISAQQEERAVCYNMELIEALNYHNKLAIDFVKKHPQFRSMIKEVGTTEA